jgi:hypothetical protein
MTDEHATAADEAAQVEREIATASVTAEAALLSALESSVPPNSLRQHIAAVALARLLGKLLIANIPERPEDVTWAASIVHDLHTAIQMAAGNVASNDITH